MEVKGSFSFPKQEGALRSLYIQKNDLDDYLHRQICCQR